MIVHQDSDTDTRTVFAATWRQKEAVAQAVRAAAFPDKDETTTWLDVDSLKVLVGVFSSFEHTAYGTERGPRLWVNQSQLKPFAKTVAELTSSCGVTLEDHTLALFSLVGDMADALAEMEMSA